MRQVNIKDLVVKFDIVEILNAVSQKKKIEIDIDGKIYINKDNNLKLPMVFKLENYEDFSSILEVKALSNSIFKSYKPMLSGTICTLNPVGAWQEIILLNQPKMLYFDHQTDGVEFFEDKELEDIGWHANPCDISYREIAEFIEFNCDGIIVFYDNEVQFNGFIIVDDVDDTREKVNKFIINKIKEKIEKNLIDVEDDDIIESLDFFRIKV